MIGDLRVLDGAGTLKMASAELQAVRQKVRLRATDRGAGSISAASLSTAGNGLGLGAADWSDYRWRHRRQALVDDIKDGVSTRRVSALAAQSGLLLEQSGPFVSRILHTAKNR